MELRGKSASVMTIMKEREIIKWSRPEKHRATTSVFIVTGIGILLLATIMGTATYNRFAYRPASEGLPSFEKNKLTFTAKIKQEYTLADSFEHIKLLKSKKLRLPQQFDARLQWPLCWSVHQVPNQGGCASCWALSAVSVMSDRLCIASNYSNQKQISAEDLLSCCTECGGFVC
ncbi:unnamed protein product [Onchocerca ochengi]|uniref:Pept_C1 domain-containing protein n=1 Tax=Onchocerca ochengi TaxID=42157 RepID=A0A182ET11_ONCOC|nr:unnamed protein product [Onchocerca ochengi]